MPVIELTKEQHEIEREEELQDRDWAAAVEAKREEAKRQHELSIVRIKSAVPQRHKTITRIGVAFAKIPAMIVLAFMLPLLVLSGKEIPRSLTDFLEL